VFVVADGMGGYGGGDVASRIAVETILKAFEKSEFHVSGTGNGAPRKAREFVSAIESANALIFAEANRNSELHGMGTTIIGARFSPQKQRVFIAHVGDSRCYRWRQGELRLLTVDHTLAARGVQGPMADHIRRALGIAPQVKVDLLVDKPVPGDVYVLCSDGLTKMVDDVAVAKVLSSSSSDLDAAVAKLIAAANDAGGRDNTTVILVGVNTPQMLMPDGRHADALSTGA
jgi:serine/threonine protein phosphatase PrpC